MGQFVVPADAVFARLQLVRDETFVQPELEERQLERVRENEYFGVPAVKVCGPLSAL